MCPIQFHTSFSLFALIQLFSFIISCRTSHMGHAVAHSHPHLFHATGSERVNNGGLAGFPRRGNHFFAHRLNMRHTRLAYSLTHPTLVLICEWCARFYSTNWTAKRLSRKQTCVACHCQCQHPIECEFFGKMRIRFRSPPAIYCTEWRTNQSILSFYFIFIGLHWRHWNSGRGTRLPSISIFKLFSIKNRPLSPVSGDWKIVDRIHSSLKGFCLFK